MAQVATIALLAVSAGSSIAGGEQARDQARAESASERLNARLEKVQADKDTASVKRDLEEVEASQRAIFASRGLLDGAGSALAAQTRSRQNASRQIDEIQFGAGIRAGNAGIRSASAIASGNAKRTAGYTQAFRSGASLFDKVSG